MRGYSTRVIEQELHTNAAVITKVSETASKEFAIESALDKMQGGWTAVKLVIEDYRETGGHAYPNSLLTWPVACEVFLCISNSSNITHSRQRYRSYVVIGKIEVRQVGGKLGPLIVDR